MYRPKLKQFSNYFESYRQSAKYKRKKEKSLEIFQDFSPLNN